MARDDPQINWRCPPDLKAALEGAALDSGRTLTAEIVHRLRQTFPDRVPVEWEKTFPHAAAAAGRPVSAEWIQARDRAVFKSLRLQQLRMRMDALQNQVFTLENQAMSLHDSLLRKMGDAEQDGLPKPRKKQLQGEVDALKERLQQVDDRVKRLRQEYVSVQDQLSEVEGSAIDAQTELVTREDGRLEIKGDRHHIESELSVAGIEWEPLHESVVVDANSAARVRALFEDYPKAVLAELKRRQGPDGK